MDSVKYLNNFVGNRKGTTKTKQQNHTDYFNTKYIFFSVKIFSKTQNLYFNGKGYNFLENILISRGGAI